LLVASVRDSRLKEADAHMKTTTESITGVADSGVDETNAVILHFAQNDKSFVLFVCGFVSS